AKPYRLQRLHWYEANQTTSFAVPGHPKTLGFDGANIWVTGSTTLTKLRASEGTILGTFGSPGANCTGLAFDGANIWVACNDRVVVLRPSCGAQIGCVSVSRTGIDGTIAFDGANIWVTNSNPGGGGNPVTKLRASEGVLLSPFPAGIFPVGL